MNPPEIATEIRKPGAWWVDIALILGILGCLSAIFFSPPVFDPVSLHFKKRRLAKAITKSAPGYYRRGISFNWATPDSKTINYISRVPGKQQNKMLIIETEHGDFDLYGYFDPGEEGLRMASQELVIYDFLQQGDSLKIWTVRETISPPERWELDDEFIAILKTIINSYYEG